MVVTQTAATTRAFADQGGYEWTPAATSSVSAPAVSSPAWWAPSRSTPARPDRRGRHRRWPHPGRRPRGGAVVLLLIPVADVLRDVPLATLAAILIFVAIRLFNPGDLVAIARFDPFEFGLTAVTLFTVVLVGVEQGIGVAVDWPSSTAFG